jgi:hypothetical protein
LLLQTVKWSILNEEYTVSNVPYLVIDGEEFFDSNVSILLTTLKELMLENKISKDIDYAKLVGIEF